MKVNILVDNDKCWNLNIVKRLIPYLNSCGIEVDHIWILPKKLSKYSGLKISLWYFKTFGIIVFLKLIIFYFLVLIRNLINGINNFEDLANRYKIKFTFIRSPNQKILFNKIKLNQVKYSIIITDHILKGKILKIKKHSFINKHSSLLPSFKGLMPYFWTKIMKKKNGVTFHLVNEKIDKGKIIYQKVFNKKFNSMIEFYLYVFNRYPYDLVKSINNLKKKKFLKSFYKSSYFSLPKKNQYFQFLGKGGKIILISDFFKLNKLV